MRATSSIGNQQTTKLIAIGSKTIRRCQHLACIANAVLDWHMYTPAGTCTTVRMSTTTAPGKRITRQVHQPCWKSTVRCLYQLQCFRLVQLPLSSADRFSHKCKPKATQYNLKNQTACFGLLNNRKRAHQFRLSWQACACCF